MNRGRSTNNQRSRSNSRSRGNQSFRGRGRLGFFSKQTQQEEQQKLDDTEADVKDLRQYAQNKRQESQQPTIENQKLKVKINAKVEEGKTFINKFFRGFIQPERGNIKVELEPQISNRISEPYLNRVKAYAEQNFQHKKDKDKPYYMFNKFKGMTNLAIAIKLFKSSTESDKLLNHKLSCVRNVDIPMPKKLNVLVNQLGKTDLLNDNRIRIKQQHLLVKRYLVRGAIWYLDSELDQYLKGNNKVNTIAPIFESSDLFSKIIDETIGSVKIIKDLGKKSFLDYADNDYDFTLEDVTYSFRLPKFKFTDKNKVRDIVEYLSNSVFSAFKWDADVLGKILASLVLQVTAYPWLKQRDKKLSELEPDFAGTIIKDYTFQDVLDFCDISFINQFIDEDILDDVINNIFHQWKTSEIQHFNQIFEMEEFKFSDYGTDAQLIELSEFDNDDKNEYDDTTHKIIDRQPVKTVLKTTETGAMMGLCIAYSKHVQFSSKFEIQHDSKNSLILREFIKSDFKT